MSYLVLARKYRPRVFADVVGQEVVTGTLRGAIAEGRIGHAYLFCGPRGTGKTTTARIFAKALNCEKGPAPDPCGTCERCLAADNGSEIDIIEVDAASHTGVDYVREMREQAAYVPLRARFKIYLIDEVHMLSKGAFNALLKTLEEPPPHVKFLFATTELERLPETIVSRCQLLRLTPLNERTIVDRLSAVFDAEGVKAAPGVTAEIARRARGGMRDALSLADQMLSLSGNELAVEDLAQLAGDGGAEELDRLLDLIESGDKAQVLTFLPPAEGGEVDLLSGLLDHLRGTLVVHLCGESTPLLEVEATVRKRMKTRAERMGVERMQLWLEELLQARERMRLVPGHARLVLEVTLLDLCRPEASLPLAEILERLQALEQRLESGAGARPVTSPPSTNRIEGRAPAIEARGASAENRSAPGESRSAPVESRSAPVESRSAPVESRSAPVESRSAPVASRSAPVESRSAPARPVENRSTPADRNVLQPRPRPEPSTSAESPAKPAAMSEPRNAGVASSPTEAWNRALESLQLSMRALADLLRERGKLGDCSGARCVIKLAHLDENERALISDARNAKACSQALSKALGRSVEVVFEAAGPALKAHKDTFTTRVSDMFGGRIEDDL